MRKKLTIVLIALMAFVTSCSKYDDSALKDQLLDHEERLKSVEALRLKTVGEGAGYLKSVAGTVDGIALSRHINHGFPPVDGKPRHSAIVGGAVDYKFTKEEDGLYRGQRILLGVDGATSERLTMHMTTADDKTIDYTFNITQDMHEFHITDVKEPWIIEITLHLSADFTATIEDWKVGPESWLEAS